jgi:hypothetical protein
MKRLVILISFLLSASEAFSPDSKPSLFTSTSTSTHQRISARQSNAGNKHFALKIATDDRISELLLHEDDLEAKNNPTNSRHRLRLDASGDLRLGDGPDEVLMEGLSPSVWSASRPPSHDQNSNALFLHASHTKSLAEHQTALGDLISCRRFLACSSTYTTASKMETLTFWSAHTSFILSHVCAFSIFFTYRACALLDGPQGWRQCQGHTIRHTIYFNRD